MGLEGQVGPGGDVPLSVNNLGATPGAIVVDPNSGWAIGYGDPWTEDLKDGASSSMAVDGSSSPVDFAISPQGEAAGTRQYELHVYRVNLAFRFATNAPDWVKFGDLTALSNGLAVRFNESTIAEMTNLEDAIRLTNAQDSFSLAVNGVLAQYYSIDFVKMFGAPIILRGGKTIDVRVQDDLTGISAGRSSAVCRRLYL